MSGYGRDRNSGPYYTSRFAKGRPYGGRPPQEPAPLPIPAPETGRPFVPSKYQQGVFDALLNGRGDILVNAVAGSGKTKTLEEAVKQLPHHLQNSCLMTAFNSHIKQELVNRQRAGRIPQGVTIQTIHGLGYGVLRRAFQPADTRSWVDEHKYRRLTEYYWSGYLAHPVEDATQEEREKIRATEEMVRFAMLTLTDPNSSAELMGMAVHYGVDLPDDEDLGIILAGVPQIIQWGAEGLPKPTPEGLTYHPSQRIGYDDMIFLPVHLGLPVPHYAICMIDECQDFNRCQQELLLRVKGNGRAVWVGDPRQAIYGFTGSDSASFQRIKVMTGAQELPLSICYRCAVSVVDLAKGIVKEIEAAPDAVPGAVVEIKEDDLVELAFNHYQANPTDPFMVLCRINAPLVSLAFQLLGRGVPARVKGRDIGAQLVRTIDAIANLKGFDFEDFTKFAEQYRSQQAKVISRKKDSEMQLATLDDRVDSVLAVWGAAVQNGASSVGAMRSYITSLFTDDTSGIILSSVHKAKGLEAKKVGILRHRDTMPHRMAKQDWQIDQEHNLRYVAYTRAMDELYLSD